MENILWSKGKSIRQPVGYDEKVSYKKHEIEVAIPISQNQLNSARLFNSKYEYAKTLNKNISYLEVGVGWGESAEMFINIVEAKSADLLDLYNNAAGVRFPGGFAPKDSSITHEQYIKNKFSHHPNINTIKGNANDILYTLNKKYDLILFDSISERLETRNALKHCSKLINVNGVIGFTYYMNYDAIHYDMHVGIYQSVNEFLYLNKNWSVDAIILNDLGFHEIYIKRNL